MLRVTTLILLAACAGGGEPEAPSVPTPPVDDPPAEPVDADGDGSPVDVDCDDGDAAVFPGASELCDGRDQDCDGVADNGLVFDTWYGDGDGDGFGDSSAPVESCDGPPSGTVADATDCDDSDGDRWPGAAEQCDGLDQDCDGTPDNGLVFDTWYVDGDGDGYGDAGAPTETCDGPPQGTVADATDCDDTNGDRSPGVPEVCDGLDQDCDGTPDNGVLLAFSVDGDGDGWGAGPVTLACEAPPGSVPDGDCDDGDVDVFPGSTAWRCDGVDTDCDGSLEEAVAPTDGDLSTLLAAAVDGDVVCLEDGIHEGMFVVDTAILLGPMPGAEPVLDAAGLGRTLQVSGAATVQGLAVTGGQGTLGGGVQITGDVVLEDVEVHDNACDGICSGAGVRVDASGQLDMRGGAIRGNTITVTSGVVLEGAGISIAGPTTLTDLVIEDNVMSGPGYSRGAGLFAISTTVSLVDVDVHRNQVLGSLSPNGSGLSFNSVDGTLDRVDIRDNYTEASGGVYGGGLSQSFGTLTLTNVIAAGNVSVGNFSEGAGIECSAGTLIATNVTSVGNAGLAPFDYGAGIGAAACTTTLTNVLVQDNADSGLYVGGGSATVTYGDVYGHLVGFVGFPDPTGLDGNVSIDAQFVGLPTDDPLTWDLHLQPTSGLIDLGDPAIFDADGSRSDIGAYGGPGGEW